MKKSVLNWSSGKDAALALYKVQQQQEFSVEKLTSTVNSKNHRLPVHEVRQELLVEQAKSLGIPLQLIKLSENTPLEKYNKKMLDMYANLSKAGFTHSIFGDIFLGDVKQYREKQLAAAQFEAVFPLWKQDTARLMQEWLTLGFKAIVVCVNAKYLDISFCGRILDQQFLKDLPEEVDPCGENGEFHTFVFDAPNFREPVRFTKGEIRSRVFQPKNKNEEAMDSNSEEGWDTQFYYCDLLPVN